MDPPQKDPTARRLRTGAVLESRLDKVAGAASIFSYSLRGRPKAEAGYPFLFSFLSVLCEFHIDNNPNPTHLLLPLYLIPPTEEKTLIVEAVVYHSVSHSIYPLVHTLLSNVHCNESLVWYKVSDFCYSVDIGTLLELLWGILLLSGVTEILQF